MLRSLYQWLLHLHPARFRRRFSDEMLSIFDQIEEGPAAAKLVTDGIVSLVRQWTVRSKYWEARTNEQLHLSSGATPAFYALESFKPRPSALIVGGILAFSLFCAAFLDLRYDWTETVFMRRSNIQFETSPDVEASAQSVAAPKMPGKTLSSYAGLYITNPPNEVAVLITTENGQLEIEIPGESKSGLSPAEGNRFVFSDAPQDWIEFVKGDDGIVYELNLRRHGLYSTAHRKKN